MSEIHVMDQVPKKDQVRCAFHIAIPGANNDAVPTPMTYRNALVEYLTRDGEAIDSMVPGLDGSHDHGTGGESLENGFLVEVPQTVNYAADASTSEKATAIRDAFAASSADLLIEHQDRLQFWGSELASA